MMIIKKEWMKYVLVIPALSSAWFLFHAKSIQTAQLYAA
jgi:hypothetical protein